MSGTKHETGRGASRAGAKRGVPVKARAANRPPAAEIARYRQRMKLIGELLDAAFAGLVGKSQRADRLGHGAYLHVLSHVFDTLDGLSQGLTMDDLVRLSRVVAEQRRAEATAGREPRGELLKGKPAAGDKVEFDKRQRSQNFAEMIRRIYGVSLAGCAAVTATDQKTESGGGGNEG